MTVAALLSHQAVPAQTAAPTADAAEDNKIICKREAELGSLVRKKKTCLTRAEWKRVAEGAQDTTRRLQAEGLGGSHCVPSADPNATQC
jgi:hypothetical protein